MCRIVSVPKNAESPEPFGRGSRFNFLFVLALRKLKRTPDLRNKEALSDDDDKGCANHVFLDSSLDRRSMQVLVHTRLTFPGRETTGEIMHKCPSRPTAGAPSPDFSEESPRKSHA